MAPTVAALASDSTLYRLRAMADAVPHDTSTVLSVWGRATVGRVSRVLSLITPLWAPTADYLELTAASVAAQVLAPGWHLEWLVHEDGATPTLGQRVAALDMGSVCVVYGANHHGFGPAVTRNHALALAGGEVVACVDQDDLLAPGALAALVTALDDHPGAGWAAGRSAFGDATAYRRRDDVFAPGAVVAGEPYRQWLATGYPPLYPSGVAYHTDLLWRCGGWPGIGRAEDLVLWLAASQSAPGVVVDAVTHIRRAWPAQATAAGWMQGLQAPSYGFRRQWLAALGAPAPATYPDGSTPPDRTV